METLLELKNVVKYFLIPAGGIIRRRYKICKAVDDVTFSVDKGACFGIAGESGSGKTTIAKLILLLEKLTSGSILYEGKDIQKPHAGKKLCGTAAGYKPFFRTQLAPLTPACASRKL